MGTADANDSARQAAKNEDTGANDDRVKEEILIVRERQSIFVLDLFFIRVILYSLNVKFISHVFSGHFISIAALAGMVAATDIKDQIFTGILSFVRWLVPVLYIPKFACNVILTV